MNDLREPLDMAATSRLSSLREFITIPPTPPQSGRNRMNWPSSSEAMKPLVAGNAVRPDTSAGTAILVIDDDPLFRELVVVSLRRSELVVHEASGCGEGIRCALEQPPDLVLSDVELGDGTGYDVLKTLRQHQATAAVPFILMTGGITGSDGMRTGMSLGAADYLVKPFTVETLLATVRARLRNQEAVRQQAKEIQTRLLEILDATTDLVGMVDQTNQRITYLNQAGKRLIDIRSDESLATLRIQDFYSPDAAERLFKEAIPAVLNHGVWSGETMLRSRAGVEIPVYQVILAHRGQDGAMEYFSTVVRDISASQQAEKERREMENHLRRAQKLEAIGNLAAGIAHEINTPTQFIGDNLRFLHDAFLDLRQVHQQFGRLLEAAHQGNCTPQLLAAVEHSVRNADLAYLDEEIPKAIEQSVSGVERVARIVGAMNEFSHPGTDEKTPVDLNHAIETTVTVARNEWKYVSDLVTDFDPLVPPVSCIPGELNQVILNLIVNAAHAIADRIGETGDTKGTITVSTRKQGDWAEIRIADTGTGIPEAVRGRVFAPFFTTKCVGKGTGQGLAIARSVVVDKHGGSITFETELGRGTTFIIRFPIATNPPIQPGQEL